MSVLPVTSYPYVSLSAFYAYDDNISFEPKFQQYSNGFYFFNHGIFDDINDLSFNNYTGFYLRDKEKNRNVIKSKGKFSEEELSSSIVNLFMFSNKNYVTVGDDGYLYADEFDVENAADFRAVVDSDKIFFVYNKNSYVMMEEDSPWKLKIFSNNGAAPTNEDSYKFNLTKFNGNYVISTLYGNSSVRERYMKASINEDFVGFIGATLQDQGSQVAFNFIEQNFTPEVNFSGLDEQSWFYSYYNDVIDFEKDLNLTPNFSKSVSGIKQNFLISTPYESKITEDSKAIGGVFPTASMGIDVMSMKNIKNPNYSYSQCPYNLDIDDNFDAVCDADPESEFNKRDYKRIHTGCNQELGYEAPIFIYRTNNKNLNFKKDNTTYFHYPSSAPVINIKDSGIIEAGGFASSIPFFADKIFKKDAQYGDTIHWGDSTQLQNGQFLCAWLSGNNGNSVWMDRWYFPSNISKFNALTATYDEGLACAINQADDEGLTVIDIPSIMTLEPEVWYKYFHVGSDFIDYGIDEVINYNGNLLSIHLDDFTSETVTDKSGNSNDGEFVNYTPPPPNFREDATDTVASLDGEDTYITINYSNEVKPIDSNTVSIWAYSEDWENVKNSEIISSGNANYLNLKVTNGLENPIYCLYGNETNKLLFLNNENKVYNVLQIEDDDVETKIENLCVDSNLNIWALDNYNNNLYKINYNGVIELKKEFDSSYALDKICLDSNNNVYVLETNSGNISSFDVNGDFINLSAAMLTTSNDTFSIDLNDQIYGIQAEKVMFDSKNAAWSIPNSRVGVYREGTPLYETTFTTVEDIAIDKSDNVFVLYNQKYLYKMDEIGGLSLSATLPIESTISEYGNITIQNEYYKKTGSNEDFILVYTNGFVYKYDNNLNYVNKYNIKKISNENDYNAFLTDWSGYDVKRKYNYHVNFETEKAVEVTYNMLLSSGALKAYKLFVPAERLFKGWHHFALVFDKEASKIKFYIDGEVEGRTVTVPSESQMYRLFKNSINLGSKMGINQTFNEEFLLKEKYHFKGKIDDFRVYTKALDDLEVRLLFYSKGVFEDIEWHIPTGNQYYAEQVSNFFKHKLPGSKSNNFNIKVFGMGEMDSATREIVENTMREIVGKISPAYTQLNEIKWIE